MPRPVIYPFAEADTNESFSILNKTGNVIRRVQKAACAHKRRHPGFNYTTSAFSIGKQTFVKVTILSQPN